MSYTAADITELDDVQHTRLRPAVNLGLDVLNTALREIVDNAIEEVADPGHGGSRVTITLHADGSVSVTDNGRGIDPKDHQRIFDLFRRAGTQDKPGQGIGLAHVRALVRRLGGTMSVASELHNGSTFTITLPINWSGKTSDKNRDRES